MELYNLVAVLASLAALFAWINERLFRLPNSIGIMLIGLVLSLALLALDNILPVATAGVRELFSAIDFDTTVLQGMLSFLLFAGALHVDLNDLARRKWVVLLLATIGVAISTALVGLGMWLVVGLVGLDIQLIYCLLFGALISPTDPIAVLGILKRLGVTKDLEVMIGGESLFNDGVGVVIFMVILGIAQGQESASAAMVVELFVHEALGGALFGLALGFVGNLMLKSVDNYHVEVLITLAMVAGGYALAGALHVSGPIAMVVAGLLAGNRSRHFAMSELTRRRLDDFWELIDEILNAVLFLLIGVEVLLLAFSGKYLIAGMIAIPLALAARLVAVGLPIGLLRSWRRFPPNAVSILTWGGLRGGISVALALSLPAGPAREPIVAITYIVVIFSIAVQGLSIGPLIRRLSPVNQNSAIGTEGKVG